MPVRAQPASSTTIITIPMDASTKVLDQANRPSNWQILSTDETGWDAATPLSGGVRTCLTQKDSAWASGPAYWGSDEGRPYLFRFTFDVPDAKNYYGSTLTLAAPLGSTTYINGEIVLQYGFPTTTFSHAVIAPLLQPGKNILAIASRGDYSLRMADGTLCSGVSATITIHANSALSLRPRPKLLHLSWPSVPGAVHYYLQLWLVKAATGQVMTPNWHSNVAVQIQTASCILGTSSMPLGLYQWRIGAVTAQGQLVSWSPLRTVTLK